MILALRKNNAERKTINLIQVQVDCENTVKSVSLQLDYSRLNYNYLIVYEKLQKEKTAGFLKKLQNEEIILNKVGKRKNSKLSNNFEAICFWYCILLY